MDHIIGVILGTAVGDALGLPREGLSRRRAERLYGTGPVEHHLLGGWGMVSDDTEHTCLVGQALLRAGTEPERFAGALGWGLRRWLLGLPAGVGWATLRALCRLWLGFSPQHGGVFSAGNGPAMRAAILGACVPAPGDDPALAALVRVTTRVTHTDLRAEEGALLIARAAALAVRAAGRLNTRAALLALRGAPWSAEWQEVLARLEESLHRQEGAAELAARLGLGDGVSGYVLHTVPMALYCWLRHGDDFRAAVEAVIRLGGDTDSTGAIVGGLMGATLGPGAIPAPWLAGLRDWPMSVSFLRRLGARLEQRFATTAPAPGGDQELSPLPLPFAATLLRNLFFMVVVLGHGFRRLLPPY